MVYEEGVEPNGKLELNWYLILSEPNTNHYFFTMPDLNRNRTEKIRVTGSQGNGSAMCGQCHLRFFSFMYHHPCNHSCSLCPSDQSICTEIANACGCWSCMQNAKLLKRTVTPLQTTGSIKHSLCTAFLRRLLVVGQVQASYSLAALCIG